LRQKKSKGEYLAFLSVKYGVNSENFLDALRQAADKGKEINCCQFLVKCRGKTKTDQIFSIKDACGIIAQFKVSNDFLVENGKSLKEFMHTNMVRKYLAKKRKTSHSHFIKDVRPGMNHVNLKARVLAVTEPTHIVTRYGSHASVAKVLIADETGTINLCLWNAEIDSVSIGTSIQIVNAKVSAFKGEKQLTLGIRGTANMSEGDGSIAVPPVSLIGCKS
jgi:hypothetical protein